MAASKSSTKGSGETLPPPPAEQAEVVSDPHTVAPIIVEPPADEAKIETPNFDDAARAQREADHEAELAAKKHDDAIAAETAAVAADELAQTGAAGRAADRAALMRSFRECMKCTKHVPCSPEHYGAAGHNPDEYEKLFGERKAQAQAKLRKAGAAKAHFTVCEVSGAASVVTSYGTFAPGDVAEFADSDIASLPESLIPVS